MHHTLSMPSKHARARALALAALAFSPAAAQSTTSAPASSARASASATVAVSSGPVTLATSGASGYSPASLTRAGLLGGSATVTVTALLPVPTYNTVSYKCVRPLRLGDDREILLARRFGSRRR